MTTSDHSSLFSSNMGSANSTILPEPLVAAVAVAGVLGYGYVHYVHPSRAGGADTDADTNPKFLGGLTKGSVSALHGQKKRGRKLQLPGDATLKNLDFLDSSLPRETHPPPPPPVVPTPATRQKQQQPQTAPPTQDDVVPGGFERADTSSDAHGAFQSQQQQQPSADVKKQQQQQPRKKRGKKVTASSSDPSSAAPADVGATAVPTGKAEKASSASAATAAVAMADAALDERWTRVEARKKKAVPPQDRLNKLQTKLPPQTDPTTSDAGITTSVTGTSSPVTERTTEDELPFECVVVFFLFFRLSDFCLFFFCRSAAAAQGLSASDAAPLVAPVRPLPGEQPAKGFAWEDYEGVQVDGDASSEDDGGWGVVRSRRRGVLPLSIRVQSTESMPSPYRT